MQTFTVIVNVLALVLVVLNEAWWKRRERRLLHRARAAEMVAFVLSGGALTVSTAPEGMTLEEAQARVDRICRLLSGERREVN